MRVNFLGKFIMINTHKCTCNHGSDLKFNDLDVWANTFGTIVHDYITCNEFQPFSSRLFFFGDTTTPKQGQDQCDITLHIFSTFLAEWEDENGVPRGTIGRAIRAGGNNNSWRKYMRGELGAEEFVEAFSRDCSRIVCFSLFCMFVFSIE